jgi:hypothetical protein
MDNFSEAEGQADHGGQPEEALGRTSGVVTTLV